MKQLNIQMLRDMFINEPSSDEEGDVTLEDYHDKSSDEKTKAFRSINEGVIGNASIVHDDSYSEYLNNADLEPS